MHTAWLITAWLVAALAPAGSALSSSPHPLAGVIAGRASAVPPPPDAPVGGVPVRVAARAPGPVLVCDVATPLVRPLGFTPPVRLVPGRVAVRGNFELTGCASAGRSAASLRSGWAVLKATAQASCTSVRQVRGSVLVTWFDVTGRPAGTSKVRLRADRLVARHPAEALLDGAVTAGRLTGARVHGVLAAPATLLGCATAGTTTLSGAGRITFR
ncbi:hypothetical protein [Nonomuraea aridisoli]|uniref:Uncharacterized protein n=1 Tax=Nonomuraea aridisoli TaxID=2070368 RepID=A0A2W2EJ31_9ACTN|nr:hypothetical protein [Nonomuraea aridisoli]PZG16795.1 hypothetical protein C1J01_19965 [Nonomuraea aridisoli]